MVLNPLVHVRNTIFILHKQKKKKKKKKKKPKFRYLELFSEKIDFFFNVGLFSLKIRFLSPVMFDTAAVSGS